MYFVLNPDYDTPVGFESYDVAERYASEYGYVIVGEGQVDPYHHARLTNDEVYCD